MTPRSIDAGDTEAGPSTQVVFKKRGSGRVKTNVGIKSFAVEEDTSSPSTFLPNGNDEEEQKISIEDLVALRALRNRPQGIDLNRLNRGETKKKKKKKQAPNAHQTEDERWAEQMQRGGLVTRSDGKSKHAGDHDEGDYNEDEDSEAEGPVRARTNGRPRLIKENNFQGETGTVDVDKHMMAYIEEEMNKRRRGEVADKDVIAAALVVNNGDGGDRSDASKFRTAEDELYNIADKYRQIQQAAKEAIVQARSQIHDNDTSAANAVQAAVSRHKDHASNENENDEGNVALSTSMLTSVPEIDLGMEMRTRNIEATEKARKAMEDMQRNRRKEVTLDDSDFAAARFFRHAFREPSDAEHMRKEAEQELPIDSTNKKGSEQLKPNAGAPSRAEGEYKRRQTATDDAVMDRFKKRQRNQLKR